MATRKFSIPATVIADGSGTFYSPRFSGLIESVQYVKSTYVDGVDFAVTLEATTEGVWSESNVNAAVIKHPRAATHSTAGVALVYASGGTAVNDKIAVGNDRVKFAVTSGGTSTTGTFVVTVTD